MLISTKYGLYPVSIGPLKNYTIPEDLRLRVITPPPSDRLFGVEPYEQKKSPKRPWIISYGLMSIWLFWLALVQQSFGAEQKSWSIRLKLIR